MPAPLKKVLYTAEAVVEGGREGHGRTSDGRLEVDLSVPAAMSARITGCSPKSASSDRVTPR